MTKDEIGKELLNRASYAFFYGGTDKELSLDMRFAKDFDITQEDIEDFFRSTKELNSISPTQEEWGSIKTIGDLADLVYAHRDRRWFQEGIEIIIDDAKFYYSQKDEACFFSWLESIYGVKSVVGSPKGLTLKIQNLDFVGLRELLAVTGRYEINQKSLAALCLPENEEWFKNKEAYWYEGVFGA